MPESSAPNHQDVYRPSRRGEANRHRRGTSKTHRHLTPVFTGSVPRGTASKVVACFRQHDWCRNSDLIALRRTGYTPYGRIFDPSFRPKPMRITPRSESREALTALSLVLAANSDYSPDSDYMFEVMLPLEEIARRMNALHVYESGRKAYDVALHALRVLEELDYVVVHRDRDTDSGQNKPVRIFLTERCFTSRGIAVEDIRQWLHKYRQWAVTKGVAHSQREKYERHLLRMARLGMDIDKHHSLKNRLRQIKRWVVSPELRAERRQLENGLGAQLDRHSANLVQLRAAKRDNTPNRTGWMRWVASGQCTTAQQLQAEHAVKALHPQLHLSDPERYYALLLEQAGIPL
ncbi:Replication protein [Pantoea coffeiphila]|uniref:Replication protein n=1 Tax=Pantoea coffeiphila TaxID=1465635 RepID=A0A2S9I763_9GAMM|nr:Replication protein [Pantoea coffeiphila]PRD13621.1 Replication protein [Pantoea coffeiphila]